ncbi:MAG TPA: hypothetical protein VK949_05715 [Methylotenera sp.]|nr:hypothetical protein [Methylotenera sp.]
MSGIKSFQRWVVQVQLIAKNQDEVSALCSHWVSANLDFLRHASEQYLTSSQLRAQALRQVMSRPHCTHGLCGKLALLPLNVVRVMWLMT